MFVQKIYYVADHVLLQIFDEILIGGILNFLACYILFVLNYTGILIH